MKLIDLIKEQSKTDEKTRLWLAVCDIVKDVKEHLKLISSQMKQYDIHDERHSEKVIENIEKILADKLESLSFYESILLYLAAYLHDSGMALPEWEYKTLEIVEKCDKYSPIGHPMKNDFKFSKKSELAKKILQYLGFNYKNEQHYIFIEDSEEKVVENISDLIDKYEFFRDGYAIELKEKSENYSDYEELSKILRSEFIRKNHPEKSANNIENLRSDIKADIDKAIGKRYAKHFREDLKSICQAHGENIDFIRKLPMEREDWKENKNNIQFLAEMLRLGDIVHFSSDRAPLSLFSEKLIINEESIKNWIVKFQDIKYKIKKNGKQIKIAFEAFCDEPEKYYFLTDYIKWIDDEICNFHSLKQSWETLGEKYDIVLYPNVSTKKIEYDENKFIPDLEMKFTLDQSKILDLLGGVQLYEDKFACLREVYQNALDTSKCLLAYNKSRSFSENINIEFGIGEEELEGRRRKFIYCRDQGLGMSKDIIKKYLLHIGHSYYNSGDFYRNKAQWNSDVKPTSQFGIGILSCYMIADKIGITTKYYEDKEPISCVFSGISERFYYKNPSRSDKDKIGEHGTIIKLYLKDEYAENINSDFIPKMPIFLIMKTDPKNYKYDQNDKDTELLTILEKVKNNLFYILFQYIGIQHSEIPVVIRISEEKTQLLYQYNQIFEYKKYKEVTKDDIKKLTSFCNYIRSIENIDYIKNYIVETKTDNIILYTLLSLPKKGVSVDKVYGSSLRFNGETGIVYKCLCDGITVDLPEDLYEYLNFDENVLDFSFVNFHGKKRPVLSVDRSKFVDFPKFSDEELCELKEKFVSNIVGKIMTHMSEENINSKDPEFLWIYQSILKRYHFGLTSRLLQETISTLNKDVFFYDKGLSDLKINDIFSHKSIDIKNMNFLEYQNISQELILAKCVNAAFISILDENLHIESGDFNNGGNINEKETAFSTGIVRSDNWKGKYKEYDIVTSLWPFVNPNLYDSIGKIQSSGHLKNLRYYYTLIAANFFDIDLFSASKGSGELVLMRSGNFFKDLFDEMLFSNIKIPSSRRKFCSHTLFAYISPRNLTSNGLTNSTYSNGWSIYLFQAMGKYIIVPGLISREEIEKKIPESFKETDITYVDTNGKIVIQGKK